MALVRQNSVTAYALRQWYWLLAIMLTLLIWAGLALWLRPQRDPDGSYATNPYGLGTSLENRVLDQLFLLRDALHPEKRARGYSEPITIIEIDEGTIKDSGVRLQKWRRDWYARLIDRASVGGASVIGLDILLSEAGGTSAEDKAYDQELIDAMARAGNVVIVSTLATGGFEAAEPLPMFSEAAYAVGFANIPLDTDNVVRTTQLKYSTPNEETQLSFATRVAEGYLASKTPEGQEPPILRPISAEMNELGTRAVPLRKDGNLQLDFRTYTPGFRRISGRQILSDGGGSELSDDLFKDRIVMIGASNIDAPDLFPSPFFQPSALARLFDKNLPTAPARTPGVELHATALATMLFGDTLQRPGYGWQLILLLLPLGLTALAVFRLRALVAFLIVVLIAIGTLAISTWAFNTRGLILPLASAWLGVGVLTAMGLGLRHAHERALRDETEAERAEMMDIFSRCVSEDVAEELWQRRDKIMSGERRVVSIIFTDIRNFTTLSETTSSDQLVQWLNDYFSRMHKIIDAHGGHINKFIGDGLMIVFGAPATRGDAEEARAAVSCGLEMLAEVERMNKEWKEAGKPNIAIGVGIHTGEATCGVVGAERRLEYTVVGNTVNLSARLESTTKEYSVPLLTSEATARLLGDKYQARALGEVKVKGKNISTKIFAVTEKHEKPRESEQVAVA